jgi:hypothetical protein
MTPRAQIQNPTAGALRAAKAIQRSRSNPESLPELIERETVELLEILEHRGPGSDLIESRSQFW